MQRHIRQARPTLLAIQVHAREKEKKEKREKKKKKSKYTEANQQSSNQIKSMTKKERKCRASPRGDATSNKKGTSLG